jgi:hypothetical protein
MSSMRRFLALFSGVSFGTMGSASPFPRVVSESAGTPWPTRKVLTASARSRLRVRLDSVVPSLSV